MSLAADRLASALADRYRLERELGQGGMATVYLAADLKHDRKVAIKVLKPELAAVLGAERFVQEIKTTAALSHPHILPLFDSGEADGFLYYVMPYIQGETIREKLNRETQLGIEEAVKITTEVADALEYAHQNGVIHRDIKPENILLHNGRPMVMDFGIALAVSAAAGGRMTETGLSLGTPHYMSPEQATADKQITARSDVYSLASVLYEMLAGQPPHLGGSAQQIIMKIIAERAQPVTELRASVPPNVGAALGKALEKLPADRFESAKAFAGALANPAFGVGSTPSGVPAVSRRGTGGAWAGWGVAAVLAVVLVWSLLARGPVAPEPSTRFTLSLGNEASADIRIAISPDGRQIVQPGPGGRLLVRDLGSLEPRMLAAAHGRRPAVSPDGRWIAYQSDNQVMKVPMEGGTPIPLGPCYQPTWVDSERLVCSEAGTWGLLLIGSGGGATRQLTATDTAAGEVAHWSPDVIPGGHALIFTSYRRPASRIEVLDLETGRRAVVVENSFYARYARSGHLLFMRDSALFAVRFNPKTLQTEGSPVPVLEDVAARPSDADAGVAISHNGTLVALRQSQWWVDSRIVWVDRGGRETGAATTPGAFTQPRLSPDGSRILVTAGRLSRNLWVIDQRRGLPTQLTRNPGSAFYGVWTPDGRDVLFTNETPSYDVFRVAADGSRPPSAVVSTVPDKFPYSVSPDGKLVAYGETWGYHRIFVAPIDGSGPARAVGDTTMNLRDPSFSPNGRWLAVRGALSAATKSHIHLLRTDGTGGALPVTGGDAEDAFPHWTRGGRELVFRRETAVYAVDVDPATGEIATERRLFDGDYAPDQDFDVSPDGNRFLMVKFVARPEAQPLLVITNFFDELARRVGQ